MRGTGRLLSRFSWAILATMALTVSLALVACGGDDGNGDGDEGQPVSRDDLRACLDRDIGLVPQTEEEAEPGVDTEPPPSDLPDSIASYSVSGVNIPPGAETRQFFREGVLIDVYLFGDSGEAADAASTGATVIGVSTAQIGDSNVVLAASGGEPTGLVASKVSDCVGQVGG